MHQQHTLPARPPQTAYTLPPARSTTTAAPHAGFMPRSVAVRAPLNPAAPTAVYPQSSVSTPYHAPASAYATSSPYYDHAYPAYAAAVPQAPYANPTPVVPGVGGTYDLEEEARIAEWNSAYNSRDDTNVKRAAGANATARPESNATAADADPGVVPNGKRKTVVREGGGKTWEDATLLEWDPLHPRLFIGNLAGEVTDDSLHKAFSRYASLVKARVVRDKKSTKSKSYGFVSFSDTDDYFRAFKEMNGKYIGSHPVTIKRATSEVKAVIKKDDKRSSHGKHGKNNAKKNKSKNSTQAERPATVPAPPVVNPVTFIPRGVHKKGKNGGPRILG